MFELIVRDGAITNNSKDVYFQIRFAYPTDEANRRRAEAARPERHRQLTSVAPATVLAYGRGRRRWLTR